MLFRDALIAIPRRIRRPATLGLMGGILLFNMAAFGFSALLHRFAPPTLKTPPNLLTPVLLVGIIVGSLYLFGISPLAWQWTGDEKRMARPLRGILQCLVLNSTYTSISTLFTWCHTVENLKASLASSPRPITSQMLHGMLAAGLVVSIGTQTLVGFAMAYWETRTAEKKLALRQAEEARWSLLKAQMSPHVLLNSLNGLAELVREDTGAAVKGMRNLAEIYRQLLTLGEAPKVPMLEERKLLQSYLDVEKLRLGEALRVEWDWDPALDAVPVMPLILQPLLENAIKHGVAADPQGGLIRISGRLDPTGLHLAVANTGQSPVQRKGTGVGLRNLKSRLELAYGGRATFDLVREVPWTRAELHLPLEEAP